jgi:hypothetical protein
VSTASAASGSGRKPIVLILAIIGVLAIIVGILWMLGVAPGFLDVGSRVKDSGHHLIRGAVAIVVGLGLGVFAFIQNRKS